MHHSPQPHLYLDTNIILDEVLDRPDGKDSKAILERLVMHGWKCSTSRFAFVEMLDALQRETSHRLTYLELNKIYDDLWAEMQGKYSFIQWEYPVTKEFWDDVEIITGVTNLRAQDSIHVATVQGTLCDLIVTKDKDFVRIAAEEVPVRFQIPTALPQDIDEALSQLGFTINEAGQAIRGAARRR